MQPVIKVIWLFYFHQKKCPCQNLYQVVYVHALGLFSNDDPGWPWPFLWQGQICFLILLYSLYSIEGFMYSKFVLIQHILSTQMRNTGPVVLWFSFPSDFLLQSYALFSTFFFFVIVSLWNLVNKLPRELLELGSWYLAHRLCPRCRWPD